jgi:hypothetical protein
VHVPEHVGAFGLAQERNHRDHHKQSFEALSQQYRETSQERRGGTGI